jgi:hypothetical protein
LWQESFGVGWGGARLVAGVDGARPAQKGLGGVRFPAHACPVRCGFGLGSMLKPALSKCILAALGQTLGFAATEVPPKAGLALFTGEPHHGFVSRQGSLNAVCVPESCVWPGGGSPTLVAVTSRTKSVGVGGANHRGGSQLMRFTRLDPGGQCHCCLAKMSMQHTPPPKKKDQAWVLRCADESARC